MVALLGAMHTTSARKIEADPIDEVSVFSRIELHDDLSSIEQSWRQFESEAICTPYQTFDWIASYVKEHAENGTQPIFALARFASGRPALLAPFTVETRYGLRIASFLGAKHANYHMPIFSQGYSSLLTQADCLEFLTDIGRAADIDVFALTNQPPEWNGHANPFATLKGSISPSNGYKLNLDSDGEETLKRILSSDTRKKLKKKERRLQEQGIVWLRRAETESDVDAILSVFFEQKAERFAALRIANPFSDADTQAFIQSACRMNLEHRKPTLELYALHAGKRIVAVFGGSVHQGRFSGMFMSFEADDTIAKSSPGDLMITYLIRDFCRRGLESLDFGVGEARYKNTFSDQVEPLRDSFIAMTTKGRIYATLAHGGVALKRYFKRHPMMLKKIRSLSIVS